MPTTRPSGPTTRRGHLHDQGADAAAGRVDEDAVAGLNAGLDELVRRHAGQEASRRVGEGGRGGLVGGEAGWDGDVFGQGAGPGWEGVAGGQQGHDFVAFAEASLGVGLGAAAAAGGHVRVVVGILAVAVLSVGMPYVLDDAGQVHLRHLEDGADVESCKGDFDEDPFFWMSGLGGKASYKML
ncbi:hypothetical protein CCMA1212_004087 [Trichoderma ghanense]|uniref:Uncharacterized protein n=1 Tax=Trichoderma ghanense TaxID=65468 RepID=A0ABY2H8H2_9HYPO